MTISVSLFSDYFCSLRMRRTSSNTENLFYQFDSSRILQLYPCRGINKMAIKYGWYLYSARWVSKWNEPDVDRVVFDQRREVQWTVRSQCSLPWVVSKRTHEYWSSLKNSHFLYLNKSYVIAYDYEAGQRFTTFGLIIICSFVMTFCYRIIIIFSHWLVCATSCFCFVFDE